MSAEPWVLWIAGGLAFMLVALGMFPAVRGWNALGRRDREVSLRKVHTRETPRVGGLVLMMGCGIVAIRGLAGTTELSAAHEWASRNPISGVGLGALICGLAGLYDDLVGLRARYKLLAQVVAASLAVFVFGLRWEALAGVLGPVAVLADPLTVLFLVAGVNAINLSDGLDGLAAGNVALGLLVILLASVSHGATEVAVGWIAATALGAVLGFLMHNRHPARVFMGDAGSYFLGFLLTGLLLLVHPVRERVAVINFSIPLMVLALPLFDMTLAIVRRALRGQPIFAPDGDHIHHRMLARGLPHARVVVLLWLSTALFAGLAYLNVIGVGGWWTLTGAVLAIVVVGVVLGYHELLRRLPAFTGDRLLGLRDQRREVMEILAAIDRLSDGTAGTSDLGESRWLRLTPELAPILARLGVPGFQVRRGAAIVARAGEDSRAWAWLSLPLREAGAGAGVPTSEPEGAELRLALAVRLPELRSEQLMLLERVVAVLAGTPRADR
jgi:UDP-GlcNAc:undecaprenyl-phosphate GlcNAc-1-phosphate transferase